MRFEEVVVLERVRRRRERLHRQDRRRGPEEPELVVVEHVGVGLNRAHGDALRQVRVQAGERERAEAASDGRAVGLPPRM